MSDEVDQDDAVTARLRGFAALAVDDPAAAGEQLADWAGRRPGPASEARLRQMARLATLPDPPTADQHTQSNMRKEATSWPTSGIGENA